MNLLRINEASLFETFSSLKIRNLGYTPSCLQLLKKSLSTLIFFLQKSLTVTIPCFHAISLYMFIIFLNSTKLEIVWKEITTATRFNHTMIFFKSTN